MPKAAAGVYTIWDSDTFVYVGMSGRGLSREARDGKWLVFVEAATGADGDLLVVSTRSSGVNHWRQRSLDRKASNVRRRGPAPGVGGACFDDQPQS